MISTAVKSNVEINCLKGEGYGCSWRVVVIYSKELYLQIELISPQTDHGGRELATAWSLGRGLCYARYYL